MTRHAADERRDPSPPTPRRRRALRLLYLVLTGVVVYFVGRAVVTRVGSVPWEEITIRPAVLALAGGSLLVRRWVGGTTLRTLVRAFGVRANRAAVYPAYWTASLGRYVPGKMATVAGLVVLLRRRGVPGPVGLGAAVLMTGLMVVVNLTLAAPLLYLAPGLDLPAGGVWCLLVVAGGLVALSPGPFLRLSNAVLRRLGRPTIETRPSAWRLALAAGLTAVQTALLALGAWLLARSFGAAPPAHLPLFVAVAGASLAIGFIALFAPAGIGVREGIYLAALAPAVGPGPAALVAVAIRAVEVAVDLVLGAAGAAMLRRRADTALGNRTPDRHEASGG